MSMRVIQICFDVVLEDGKEYEDIIEELKLNDNKNILGVDFSADLTEVYRKNGVIE